MNYIDNSHVDMNININIGLILSKEVDYTKIDYTNFSCVYILMNYVDIEFDIVFEKLKIY